MANQSNSIDLAQLFQTVTGNLSDNRQQLNDADDNNHDHGDNMVDTFEVITQAMRERKGADPADQLEYAARMLRQRKSGSSQMYASGLEQASQEFQGQQVTPANAMTLIQALLGGGWAAGRRPSPNNRAAGWAMCSALFLGVGSSSLSNRVAASVVCSARCWVDRVDNRASRARTDSTWATYCRPAWPL